MLSCVWRNQESHIEYMDGRNKNDILIVEEYLVVPQKVKQNNHRTKHSIICIYPK